MTVTMIVSIENWPCFHDILAYFGSGAQVTMSIFTYRNYLDWYFDT